MNNVYEWTPTGPGSLDALVDALAIARENGAKLVTTNGCFDLLHPGHIAFLSAARAQGDLLVVGLNSDSSVHRLKGAGRPLLPQDERAAMLMALRAVDHVVVFDAPTPEALLARLRPNIHCKAGDYAVESLPETAVVEAAGGEVRILPLREGFSTSRLLARALEGTGSESAAAKNGLDLVLDDANLVRQTGYALREQLAPAAALVRAAQARGNNITVSGNRTSGAIVAAAGLPYDVYLPPGERGDVLFVIMADATPEELPRVVAAAHGRGITIIALLSTTPSPLADVADLCMRVPTDDPLQARLAMVAAMRAIGTLANCS